MKVILIVTTLWQGDPEANTVSFPMRSMAECHKQAQTWIRYHGGLVIVTCKVTNDPATQEFKVSFVRPTASPAIH
jgi:hypothetical protein